MAITTDILEFTLGSMYGDASNRGMNVFQYELTTDAPFSLVTRGNELCNLWFTEQTDLLKPITSTHIVWDNFKVRNLSDNLEEFVGVPDVAAQGSVAAEALPPYAAWGFKLIRSTSATRNGSKRFWGVPETYQVNGTPAGASIVQLPIIADALGATLLLTLTELPEIEVELTPVIVRKSSSGGLIASQPVSDGQFRFITTQNSRKFGRGM